MEKSGLTFLPSVLRSSICAVLLTVSIYAAAEPPRQAGAADAASGVLTIDRTWAGIPVNISAVAVGPIVYVGYYDADRQLSVARIDTADGSIRKRTLGSVFAGWDAHNYITLSYDRDGVLHVAGNMHAAPLVYARMREPGDFDSLARVEGMTGKDEVHVTYPRFFTMPSGQLGFTYRSGKSGDGVEVINSFDRSRWTRLSDVPIFAPDSGGVAVNAYHTDYITGPDGYFHTAWVWRLNSGVESNFNVNYAKSKDLKNWTDSKGRRLALPMTPSNTDLVDKVAPNSGLFNNIRLGFNGSNEPVISYVKYDKDGNTQLYHARSGATGWQVAQVSDWHSRWDFSGGGTRIQDVWFSGVSSKGGKVTETIRHFKEGNVLVTYQNDAMKSVAVVAQPASPSRSCASKPWKQTETSIASAAPGAFKGKIVWRALPAGNSDRPRSCEQLGLGAACSMVSELMLVAAAKASPEQSRLLACAE